MAGTFFVPPEGAVKQFFQMKEEGKKERVWAASFQVGLFDVGRDELQEISDGNWSESFAALHPHKRCTL